MGNNGWKEITLGEFVTLQRGHDLTEGQRQAGDVPVMGSSGINGYHNVPRARGPGVTIGRSGVGSIGVVNYSPVDYWPHNTVLYVTDFHENHPRFVYYFLRSMNLRRYDSGSAQSSLNRNYIYPIKIRVPCPEEQCAIAGILGALDDKIDLNRKMNATLEALARALFQSWFVDFDPVRAKAAGRAPHGIDAATAALFPAGFEDSALGKVPRGWRATTLEEVIDIFDSRRIPLSGKERAMRRGVYPYYGAASVMDYIDDYRFDGIYILIGEDGSVINDDDTPVVQYAWGKFWVNNHAHVLRGKGISNEHVLLFLQTVNIRPFVTGAVQMKINQGNLCRIPFVKPSESIAKAFGQIISPLYAQLRANTEQSRTLTAIRDALLPKLLSGEIRVGEAERIAEEVL